MTLQYGLIFNFSSPRRQEGQLRDVSRHHFLQEARSAVSLCLHLKCSPYAVKRKVKTTYHLHSMLSQTDRQTNSLTVAYTFRTHCMLQFSILRVGSECYRRRSRLSSSCITCSHYTALYRHSEPVTCIGSLKCSKCTQLHLGLWIYAWLLRASPSFDERLLQRSIENIHNHFFYVNVCFISTLQSVIITQCYLCQENRTCNYKQTYLHKKDLIQTLFQATLRGSWIWRWFWSIACKSGASVW